MIVSKTVINGVAILNYTYFRSERTKQRDRIAFFTVLKVESCD